MKIKFFIAFLTLASLLPYLFGSSSIIASQENPRPIPKHLFSKIPFKTGPIIPGLKQNFVPQGLAYLPQKNLYCLSLYSESNAPSILTFIDKASGKLLSTKQLKKSKNTDLIGHVGGVALSSEFIFVASERHIYQYKFSSENTLTPIKTFPTTTAASFCTYYNDILFVGDFIKGKGKHLTIDRKGINKYALICAYTKESREQPAFAISIRQKVQGVAFTNDEVILSVSHGRRNNSIIARYHNPLNEKPHSSITLNNSNKTIPLYYIDGKNHIETITFPPMSEGIAIVDDQIAILTESGANKYLAGGKGPVDNIILIKK